MPSGGNIILDYLSSLLYSPEPKPLDISAFPEQLRSLGRGIGEFGEHIMEIRQFAYALSRGQLNTSIPGTDDEIIKSLKALHDSLLSVTRQTELVAAGDYTQQLDFIDDFSASINYMISQLQERETEYMSALDASEKALAEKERELRKLQGIAFFDSLTNCYSRHMGLQILDLWLREEREFTLSFIDLDNLKYVNDVFGHAEGDRYITSIAKRLKNTFEKSVIARLGGDEFMLLSARPICEISPIMEFLQAALITDRSYPFRRSISYGIVSGDETRTASELLALADERMYACKRTHKSRSSAQNDHPCG